MDFEDLELGVRDLLADDARCARRWSERFELIMVDEFQDTNRLQLDVLEALERDNLFAVGDEFQSIYGFRHADVDDLPRAPGRARRRAGARPARATSAPREELLDVLNAAFAPELRRALRAAGRRPRRAPAAAAAGGGAAAVRPRPAAPGEPPVELLLTDPRGWDEHAGELGLAALAEQPWRRAEARLVAHRLREEVDAGRRPGEIVVLVRATASLRLFEQALEEQGLPTYVVGGRGYWSQEQVRDGLAYLAALANPRDEAALYGVLASPFCGAGADALVLLAAAGPRRRAAAPWAALRAAPAPAGAAPARRLARRLARRAADARPRRLAFAASSRPSARGRSGCRWRCCSSGRSPRTGYDLAILARAGGERRLANLRKLMRLAREYERAEGRDLRGFLAYAATQDLAQAREGEARARVRGARRGAADDDPPRQGPRVPGRLRRRPRPPRRRRARRGCCSAATARSACGCAARRRRRRPGARLRAARRRAGPRRRPRRSGGCSTWR